MRNLVLAAALAASVALSGCSGVVNTAVSDINAVTGALSSPSATQAAANLKAGATAVMCDVGNISGVASALEADLKAGTALVQDTATVYTVSETLCAALGGSVLAVSAVVPATASATMP